MNCVYSVSLQNNSAPRVKYHPRPAGGSTPSLCPCLRGELCYCTSSPACERLMSLSQPPEKDVQRPAPTELGLPTPAEALCPATGVWRQQAVPRDL